MQLFVAVRSDSCDCESHESYHVARDPTLPLWHGPKGRDTPKGSHDFSPLGFIEGTSSFLLRRQVLPLIEG
jgi:hypothetical protein